MATPYVISSDLVSAYPAKSLEIAQYIDGQVPLLAMTQNAQTGTTYSFVAADFTKLVTLSNASPVAVELPLEATVPWPTGTQLRLLNQGAGTVTVAGAVGVTINGTPLTLAQYKGANLIKTGTDVWTFIPFASGVGAAVFSDTPTGTYTGYAYKTFSSGSNTLTVTTAGFADIIVLGAGGSSNNATGSEGGGGGGAGGALVITNAYLPAGTLTCVVGAGGTGGQSGNSSRIGTIFYGIGGGSGGNHSFVFAGQNGGSGGGGSLTSGTGTGAVGQGNNGATGFGIYNQAFGGGGGAGGNGVSPTVSGTGGAGGAGSTTTIAGTTPTGAYVAGSYAYGGGGGGMGPTTGGAGGSGGGGAGSSGTGAGTNGTANTGGGGGGGYNTASRSQGGSGLIIVRVAV
jgi:fibronectin-binding autotransporter adhesin